MRHAAGISRCRTPQNTASEPIFPVSLCASAGVRLRNESPQTPQTRYAQRRTGQHCFSQSSVAPSPASARPPCSRRFLRSGSVNRTSGRSLYRTTLRTDTRCVCRHVLCHGAVWQILTDSTNEYSIYRLHKCGVYTEYMNELWHVPRIQKTSYGVS